MNFLIKNINYKLILLISFVLQCKLAANQNIPIEVAKCTQYKKAIFETVTTFSALIYDAPEMNITTDSCKQISYKPFIVNGVPADPKEFPHIARLGYAEANKPIYWFCAGTLISERFVLTAAHCFYSVGGEVNRVRLGALEFSNVDDRVNAAQSNVDDFIVKQTIQHPGYAYPAIYNDIGLVELAREVSFDMYKHPACLPIDSGVRYSKFIAIGWGATANEASSKNLLKVALDRVPYERCQYATDEKFTRGLVGSSQICAGANGKNDTCYGDSGGPLLAVHPSYPCMYHVFGVTSVGLGSCGTPELPGIYTRVFHYVDWIKQNVWPNEFGNSYG